MSDDSVSAGTATPGISERKLASQNNSPIRKKEKPKLAYIYNSKGKENRNDSGDMLAELVDDVDKLPA